MRPRGRGGGPEAPRPARPGRPGRGLGDPRFVAAGAVDQRALRRDYEFVAAARREELRRLEEELRALRERDPEGYRGSARYAEVRAAMREHRQRLGDFEARRREEEVEAAVRRAEREGIKQGKKPYFLKRREMREVVKAARFARMKEGGRAERAMELERERKDRRSYGGVAG